MRLKTACLPAAAVLAAGAAEAASPRVSAAEKAAIQAAVDRGSLIYAYDRAAWQGTDDLRAKHADASTRVGGWIVDGPAEAARLVFYDKDVADPKIVYVAEFARGRLKASRLLGAGDDRTLTAGREAMIAAVRAATASLVANVETRCKKEPFNTVVLPPASPGAPTLVYFLTPQTDLKAIPMGGHYRVEVGADGRAGKPRPFTNSCMEMPIQGEKPKDRPEALMITHLLDQVPTEMHVFSSLAAQLPIFVSTVDNKIVWEVWGARIRAVTRLD